MYVFTYINVCIDVCICLCYTIAKQISQQGQMKWNIIILFYIFKSGFYFECPMMMTQF